MCLVSGERTAAHANALLSRDGGVSVTWSRVMKSHHRRFLPLTPKEGVSVDDHALNQSKSTLLWLSTLDPGKCGSSGGNGSGQSHLPTLGPLRIREWRLCVCDNVTTSSVEMSMTACPPIDFGFHLGCV